MNAVLQFFDCIVSMPTTVVMSLVWLKLAIMDRASAKVKMAYDFLVLCTAIATFVVFLTFVVRYSEWPPKGVISTGGSPTNMDVLKDIKPIMNAFLVVILSIFGISNFIFIVRIALAAKGAGSAKLRSIATLSFKWAVIQGFFLGLYYACFNI